MCACPGWYALAATFAGIAAWLGAGRTRRWAIVWVVVSLLFSGLQTILMIQEHRRDRRAVENAQKLEQMRMRTSGLTNFLPN
jgi:hypothetical protein